MKNFIRLSVFTLLIFSITASAEDKVDLSYKGMKASNLKNVKIDSGVLSAVPTTFDPYIILPIDKPLDCAEYSVLSFKMKVAEKTGLSYGEIFWTTKESETFDQKKYLKFDIIDDGQWHTYTIKLNEMKSYTGILTKLRIDPVQKVKNFELVQLKDIAISKPTQN